MADIVNSDPNALLEQFQQAYYEQLGKRMQIGSEEYIISSIYTYALSHYLELINSSYRNQNVDTASGEFLDNIAKRYNLKRTPEAYSNPWFEGAFMFDPNAHMSLVPPRFYKDASFEPGELKIEIAGHEYVNYNAITPPTTQVVQDGMTIKAPLRIRFVSTEPHQDNISWRELVNAVNDLKTRWDEKLFANVLTDDYGRSTELIQERNISPLNSIVVELTDDEFREYIEKNRQLYVSGIAGAFESVARVASSNLHNIYDGRVRVQGDINGEGHPVIPDNTQFRPGYVDLFLKYTCLIEHPVATEPYGLKHTARILDTPYIDDVIRHQTDLLVIGQTLEVRNAYAKTLHPIYTLYAPSAYKQMYSYTVEEGDKVPLYTLKYRATIGYINNCVQQIGQSFIPSSVATYMMQPLSSLTNDPIHDCGLTEDDQEYQKWDQIKDLPCLGMKSVEFAATDNISNPYDKIDTDPEHFIQIFTGADTFEGPVAGPNGIVYQEHPGHDAIWEFI